MKKFLYMLICCLGVAGMTACSSDDDDDSAEQWAATNTAYFEKAYAEAQENSMSDPEHWMVRKVYTKDKSESGVHSDYVVIQVLESAGNTDTPIYNANVSLHYRGYLVGDGGTTIHGKALGKVFDTSWYGDVLDESTATPKNFTLDDGLVTGFTTALQYMHPGDRCLVTIPCALGYGVDGSGSIPGHSTLVFDVKLVSIKK